MVIILWALPVVALAFLLAHARSAHALRAERRTDRAARDAEQLRVAGRVGALERVLVGKAGLAATDTVTVLLTPEAEAHLAAGRRGAPEGARITLPDTWAGEEGHKERVRDIVRAKLGNPLISLRWDLSGDGAVAALYVPALPPALVPLDMGFKLFDTLSPYLGETAASDTEEEE